MRFKSPVRLHKPEFTDTWHVTEVWYCDHPGWMTWMVTCKDADGDCIGESEYYHLKSDALRCARGYLNSGRCKFMSVEKKDGQQQYVEPKPVQREVEGVYWRTFPERRMSKVHLSFIDEETLCGIATVHNPKKDVEYHRESPHLVDCAACKKIARRIGEKKMREWGLSTVS